jgi:predicted dehydrogenase
MGISIGIVGVGAFGSGFVRLFRDHPLVDRLALCDALPERLAAVAQRHQIAETYPSLDAICRSGLQALALFTQHWLHAPQAIQAMEAGKHVYSAVPIITLDDGDAMLDWCDRLVGAVRRTGMHYMLGETSYYHPEAMYCRRRAAQGAFGRFVYAEGEYLHDVDSPGCSLRDVARNRWGKDWDLSKSGGVPMHYPSHSIGGPLSVMGTRMTKVAAFGYLHPNDDWFRPDTQSGNVLSNETALFQCANGAAVRICEHRRIGHRGREGFQLWGTDACFVEGHCGGSHWMTKSSATPLAVAEMRDPLPPEVWDAWRRGAASDEGVYGGHRGSHAYLVHEFVDAVTHGRMPAVNAWEAVRYFAPGVMAHKSALRDGELLDVPDWGDPPASPSPAASPSPTGRGRG